ncbi:MAG: FliH/SctL family protein [Clostridia bacterium]|nr:FliH/SctL family protein [Clostridia bacterium]
MSNKVYKNYQVNVGIPFQIRNPMNFQNLQTVNTTTPLEKEKENAAEELSEASIESIINDAQQKAELILKEAQFESMRIIEDAEREASELKLSVEEEARQRGYEEGINEAKRQYEDLLQEAEFIKEHAKAEYKEVLAGIESEAVKMILDIARNVIGAEIAFNKEDILYLVKQAFEKCANRERVILRVSPEDFDYIDSNKHRLMSMVGGLSELEIKKDASLKEGGCLIDTPFGSIDAGVQTKLKKIEEAFRQAVGKED